MSSYSTYSVETTGTITSSWLPLTTTFTVPPVCTRLFRDVSDQGIITLLAYDPGTASFTTDNTCNPVQQTNWWKNEYSPSSIIFAIGPLICPQSWSVVQTSVKDASSTFSMCCPSGYQRSDGSNAVEVADLYLGGAAVESYVRGCVSRVTSGFVASYYAGGGKPTTTYTTSTYVYAIPMVGMNIGTASPTSSTSASTSHSSSSSSSTSSASSAAGANSNQTASDETSSGLSTGAKAGIAVGVVVTALLIIGLIAFFVLRRKKKQTTPSYTASGVESREPYSNDQPKWQRSELDARIQGHWQRSELGDDSTSTQQPFIRSRNSGAPAELGGR